MIRYSNMTKANMNGEYDVSNTYSFINSSKPGSRQSSVKLNNDSLDEDD